MPHLSSAKACAITMGPDTCPHVSTFTGSTIGTSAAAGSVLLYLTLKEVFWYELPRTLRGLAVGVRRLYLPSGVRNQVSDTKTRVVKA